jgi:hypothetical protein
MKFGEHAGRSSFLVSLRKWRKTEVEFEEFAGPKLLIVLTKRGTYDARRTSKPHYEEYS